MKKSKLILNKEVITSLNNRQMMTVVGASGGDTCHGPYTCADTCEDPGWSQDPGCQGGSTPCLETHDSCPPTSCDVVCDNPGPSQDPGCGGATFPCQG